MTYPTHPDIQFTQDSGGSKKAYQFKEMAFGGYRQRAISGTNNIQTVWNLTCKDMTLAQAKELADFLDERGGFPFYWTPPRATSPLLFTTDDLSTSALRATHETATVTYTRWFGADDS